MKTIHDVPVILRREIEALMIKPFLDAFEKELGHDKTYEIAASVIEGISLAQGAEYSEIWGGKDKKAMEKQRLTWSANGAIERETLVDDDYRYHFNITKCEYVQLYERLGMKDMGFLLSCLRDEGFYRGFNPDMKMGRTKCLMCGDDCCDFRLDFPKEDK